MNFERPEPVSTIRFPNDSIAVVPHSKGTEWSALSGIVCDEALKRA